MSVLSVFLFGEVEIRHNVFPIKKTLTRATKGLLAYLLLQRNHGCQRDVLADLFWGDCPQERARSCLSTALWRLRDVLEPSSVPRGAYLITTTSGEISFNWESDHWFDLGAFEERVNRALSLPIQDLQPAEARKLERALQLHRRELLEEFYEDWALRERERMRWLYLNGLTHLMRYYHLHRTYEEGLACGQQILQHDPLREEIHREMMQLYWRSGQRALAVRQYETCRQVLADELKILPMEETQALYQQILIDDGPMRADLVSAMQGATLSQAAHQIQQTMKLLNEAQRQLKQAIEHLERSTENGTREVTAPRRGKQ